MDYKLTGEYNEHKHTWELKASGEIDIFNSDEFKEKVRGMIAEHPGGLSIDCGELRYIDSTGLGALVALHKSVKEQDADLSLKNVGANMMRLLKITNLDGLFTLEGQSNG